MGHKGWVIIKTSDTDVIVLYVHYFPQMKNTAELWIQMGNVSFVFFSLRHHLQSYICCPCCIRMRHNFIFHGIGKTSVFKVLKETTDYFKDLDKLRNSDKDEAFTCSRNFLTRLCDQNKTFKRHIMTGTKGV